MASSRSALVEEMDQQHPVDMALTATTALPGDLAERVAAVDGVTAALAVSGTSARLGAMADYPVLAAPEGPVAEEVFRGDRLPDPRDGTIVVPWDVLGDGLEDGQQVTVAVGDRTLRLRVVGGGGWGAAAIVGPSELARLDPIPSAHAVWAHAADGTDPDELAGALEAIGRPASAELENGLARRAHVFFQLDVMTGGVVGLLAIAIVIALIGIANTLGLSVLERPVSTRCSAPWASPGASCG